MEEQNNQSENLKLRFVEIDSNTIEVISGDNDSGVKVYLFDNEELQKIEEAKKETDECVCE